MTPRECFDELLAGKILTINFAHKTAVNNFKTSRYQIKYRTDAALNKLGEMESVFSGHKLSFTHAITLGEFCYQVALVLVKEKEQSYQVISITEQSFQMQDEQPIDA